MTTDKRNKTGEELQAEVMEKIAQFSEPNRDTAARVHELIISANPALTPRLWYGMPGYALSKDSAVLCFFREDKYMTFGLSEAAQFSLPPSTDSQLMGSAWFFTELNDATEQRIIEIVAAATVKQ